MTQLRTKPLATCPCCLCVPTPSLHSCLENDCYSPLDLASACRVCPPRCRAMATVSRGPQHAGRAHPFLMDSHLHVGERWRG